MGVTTASENCVIPSAAMRDKSDAIPTDWRIVSVEDIAATRANAIVGGPFGSDLVSNDYVSVGVPVIRGQNMAGHYVSGDFAFVSPDKAKQLQANIARAGDLIFTQRGTLGQVSLVPSAPFDEYVVSQSQMKLELNARKASAEYVYQYFISAPGQKQIIDSAIQTGVPHTNLGILKKYEIPFPPTLREQEAIGEALSDADALIESLSLLLAKKRQIKQGAIEELVTGEKRLSGFSAPWEKMTLGSIGKTYGGLTGKSKADFGHGKARYVTFMNVMSGPTIDPELTEPVDVAIGEAQNRVSLGDWLFNGSSETPEEVALCSYVAHETDQLYLNSFCFGFRPHDVDSICGLFMAYFFRSRSGRRAVSALAQGATRYNISKAALLRTPLILPAGNEQRAIADVLSDFDCDILAVESRLAKARQLKQGMMRELLTGRIRLAQPASDVKLSSARFAGDNLALMAAECRMLFNN